MLIKAFLIMHWLGLLLVGLGGYWLFFTPQTDDVSRMVWIASALGLGGLMLSPYPVVKAIQWMTREG